MQQRPTHKLVVVEPTMKIPHACHAAAKIFPANFSNPLERVLSSVSYTAYTELIESPAIYIGYASSRAYACIYTSFSAGGTTLKFSGDRARLFRDRGCAIEELSDYKASLMKPFGFMRRLGCCCYFSDRGRTERLSIFSLDSLCVINDLVCDFYLVLCFTEKRNESCKQFFTIFILCQLGKLLAH